MSIVDTTEHRFERDVSGGVPVIVDFWAPWCGPCKALKPHLDTLDAKVGERLRIVKINIDEEPVLAQRFQVRSVPTLVFLRDGAEEGRLVGTTTMRLNAMVERWIGEDRIDAARDTPAQASSDPDDLKRVWSSFGGRAALRDACVARIAAIADTGRVRLAAQLADTPEQIEDELGIPLAYTTLLDAVWHLRRASNIEPHERIREHVANLIAAIPLDVDLFALTRHLQFDFLYRSKWAIAPHFDDVDVLSVLADIHAAHRRELDGETIATAEWDAIRKRAVLLAGIDGTRAAESRRLETLAHPLAQQNSEGWIRVLIGLRHDDVHREPHWSLKDIERMKTLEAEFGMRTRDTQGPRPTQPGTELAEWQRAIDSLRKTWHETERAANPAFWARFDMFQANVKAAQHDMAIDLLEQLQARFSKAATGA
ncbi:thioredoxin family protein [Pararobbsia silviterrae]|uniref:Thioredoxin n=1 Tax=Pararobbsia silviterrae TaxID=1792498 RepID=A0A494YCA1_9BURK|nr:thioredoxin family protein [Pararobbsia silviterrae]RKP57614.1 thioredoxin [Pararobbsia silviterrae]